MNTLNVASTEENEVIKPLSMQDNTEYLFSVNGSCTADVTIKVDDQPCSFLRDTGATVNIIDRGSFRKIQEKVNMTVHPSSIKI